MITGRPARSRIDQARIMSPRPRADSVAHAIWSPAVLSRSSLECRIARLASRAAISAKLVVATLCRSLKRHCSGSDRPGCCASWSRHATDFILWRSTGAFRGKILPFEMAHRQIADRLRSRVGEKALRQYISVLAGQAEIRGVDLAASASPLVQ